MMMLENRFKYSLLLSMILIIGIISATNPIQTQSLHDKPVTHIFPTLNDFSVVSEVQNIGSMLRFSYIVTNIGIEDIHQFYVQTADDDIANYLTISESSGTWNIEIVAGIPSYIRWFDPVGTNPISPDNTVTFTYDYLPVNSEFTTGHGEWILNDITSLGSNNPAVGQITTSSSFFTNPNGPELGFIPSIITKNSLYSCILDPIPITLPPTTPQPPPAINITADQTEYNPFNLTQLNTSQSITACGPTSIAYILYWWLTHGLNTSSSTSIPIPQNFTSIKNLAEDLIGNMSTNVNGTTYANILAGLNNWINVTGAQLTVTGYDTGNVTANGGPNVTDVFREFITNREGIQIVIHNASSNWSHAVTLVGLHSVEDNPRVWKAQILDPITGKIHDVFLGHSPNDNKAYLWYGGGWLSITYMLAISPSNPSMSVASSSSSSGLSKITSSVIFSEVSGEVSYTVTPINGAFIEGLIIPTGLISDDIQDLIPKIEAPAGWNWTASRNNGLIELEFFNNRLTTGNPPIPLNGSIFTLHLNLSNVHVIENTSLFIGYHDNSTEVIEVHELAHIVQQGAAAKTTSTSTSTTTTGRLTTTTPVVSSDSSSTSISSAFTTTGYSPVLNVFIIGIIFSIVVVIRHRFKT